MIELLEIIAICLVPLAMGWWPCPDCCGVEAGDPCNDCTDTPKYLKITFSGSLADQDCNACENIPTTYTLEQDAGDPCVWRANLCNCNTRTPLVITSFVRINMLLSGAQYILRCTVSIEIRTNFSTGTFDTAVYEHNFTPSVKPNCREFSGLALSFISLSDGSVCGDWSALSATVDAVDGPADDDDRQCPYCQWQSQPDEFTVEVKGTLTDGNCDCSDLGGAVTVDKFNQAGDGCCDWRGTYVGDCTWAYHLLLLDGRADVQVLGPNDAVNYQNSVLLQPHNCQATFTCAYLNNVGTTNCSGYSGTSAEVVAV